MTILLGRHLFGACRVGHVAWVSNGHSAGPTVFSMRPGLRMPAGKTLAFGTRGLEESETTQTSRLDPVPP